MSSLASEILPSWIEPGQSGYRRVNTGLFLAGLSSPALLYCVQPLLPLFAHDFGIGPTASSLALSLSTLTLALAILMAAALSESLGRRGLMAASMFAGAVLNLAASCAPSWHLLLLARALEGFVLGGVPAVAMAYVAEEIHPRGLGLSMGMYVGGTAFGGMIGRVVSGLLTHVLGWRWNLAFLGLGGVAVAAGFLMLLPASQNFTPRRGLKPAHHLQAWQAHLRSRGLLALFATGFLMLGTFVTLYNYVDFRLVAPPYQLNQMQIGLMFTLYLFGTMASWVAGRLADRLARRGLLIGGIALTGAGTLLTLAQPLPLLLTGIAMVTTGFFVTHTVASGWVGRLAVRSKGHASSLYLLSYYLGSSICGSAGGWFWGNGGWLAVVGFSLALLALALKAGFSLPRRAS